MWSSRFQRVAGFDEGAGPLVREHEDVRPLVDGERLQEIERVVVVALGVGLVQLDLDPLVAAGGGEHLVQRVAGRDDVAGAQRARAIGARPHLDHDVLGQRGCAAAAISAPASAPAIASFQFIASSSSFVSRHPGAG